MNTVPAATEHKRKRGREEDYDQQPQTADAGGQPSAKKARTDTNTEQLPSSTVSGARARGREAPRGSQVPRKPGLVQTQSSYRLARHQGARARGREAPTKPMTTSCKPPRKEVSRVLKGGRQARTRYRHGDKLLEQEHLPHLGHPEPSASYHPRKIHGISQLASPTSPTRSGQIGKQETTHRRTPLGDALLELEPGQEPGTTPSRVL